MNRMALCTVRVSLQPKLHSAGRKVLLDTSDLNFCHADVQNKHVD